MLTLRPARHEDARFLLALRNEPAVRENSRQPRVIDAVRHRRWLREALADQANRRLYVIEVDGLPAGMARLDRVPNRLPREAELSLALVPKVRGLGLARSVILKLLDHLQSLGWASVATATVRAQNLPSVAAFTRARFIVRDLERGARGPWLRMERRLA